jgi:hypothetical protein
LLLGSGWGLGRLLGRLLGGEDAADGGAGREDEDGENGDGGQQPGEAATV